MNYKYITSDDMSNYGYKKILWKININPLYFGSDTKYFKILKSIEITNNGTVLYGNFVNKVTGLLSYPEKFKELTEEEWIIEMLKYG